MKGKTMPYDVMITAENGPDVVQKRFVAERDGPIIAIAIVDMLAPLPDFTLGWAIWHNCNPLSLREF